MKKFVCVFEVPDSYEPMLAGDSATGFFFDTEKCEYHSVDATPIEESEVSDGTAEGS